MNDLLMKTDAAAMASSVEARVPFVDKEVYRYLTSAIPVEFCLSPKYTDKYLLKKILEQYLPSNLVYRDKRGFSFSFKKYKVPHFRDNVMRAIEFHRMHADAFGLEEYVCLLTKEHTDVFIEKYPRFAFSLVSNWRILTR